MSHPAISPPTLSSICMSLIPRPLLRGLFLSFSQCVMRVTRIVSTKAALHGRYRSNITVAVASVDVGVMWGTRGIRHSLNRIQANHEPWGAENAGSSSEVKFRVCFSPFSCVGE